MNWRNLFRGIILQRGQQIYENANVFDLIYGDKIYKARVLGNSEYEVTIALPIDLGVFTCTCPYAKEGNYCKHMAALRYYLEVRDLISESKESEEGEEVMTNIEQISQIPQIIAKIPRTDLEKLLLEQIKKGLLDYQVLFLLADNFSLDDFITEIEHFINLWVKSAPREREVEEELYSRNNYTWEYEPYETISSYHFDRAECLQKKLKPVMTQLLQDDNFVQYLEVLKYLLNVYGEIDSFDLPIIFDFGQEEEMQKALLDVCRFFLYQLPCNQEVAVDFLELLKTDTYSRRIERFILHYLFEHCEVNESNLSDLIPLVNKSAGFYYRPELDAFFFDYDSKGLLSLAHEKIQNIDKDLAWQFLYDNSDQKIFRDLFLEEALERKSYHLING
ncbi:MAG: hypothetical protein GX326_04480 [Clostridiaceae bacterium]|nr:hypothetical protein [Clostridiaceae bacterium]